MRLLILSASTGGAHDECAGAFAAWSRRRPDLGVEVAVFSPLEAAGWHYRIGLDLYRLVQVHWPGAHHLYFTFLEYASLHSRPWKLIGMRPYVDALERYRPDWVVSVHPHLNRGFLDLAREVRSGRRIRVGTYCTELDGGYGFTRHWVNPTCDAWIAATGPARAQALALGMPADRTMLGGFVLRPDFHHREAGGTAGDACPGDRFGLDPGRPALLLATGLAGANNHLALLEQLDRAGLDLQVLALCGRRRAVLDRLRDWRARHSGISLTALPYSGEMPRLLRAVDAIVSRGGSGTTSEAILTGCPFIANGLRGVMPQERLSLRYLERFGHRHRIRRARHLPAAVAALLDPRHSRQERARMRRALPPAEPPRVLEHLLARAG